MKDSIRKQIDALLDKEPDDIDEKDDVAFSKGEPTYAEIFLMINNIESFYGTGAQPKASMLLESFLLESMIGLKKNPENIVVESGEYYVRSIAFTPTPRVGWTVFEEIVLINTMLDLYNQGLAKKKMPLIEGGIAFSVYKHDGTETHHHEEHTHDHHHEDIKDPDQTAGSLAVLSVSEVLPMRLSGDAYKFLSRYDEDTMKRLFEKTKWDDVVVYDGDVISEE